MSEQPSGNEPTLITVPDAAARLGVTERYVRRMLNDGKLTGHLVGRRWMVNASSLPTTAAQPLADSSTWPIERDLLYAERTGLQQTLADTRIAHLEERVRWLETDRARLRAELDATRASLVTLVTARSESVSGEQRL